MAAQRKPGRGLQRLYLVELRQRLDAPYRANFRLSLRCGHCPNQRLLDELLVSHDPHRNKYYLLSNLPTSTRRDSRLPVSEIPVTGRWSGVTRPSVTRAVGAFGRPESRVDGHDVRIYECHSRCGATHTFNERHFLEAFMKAFTEGRTVLVAGVDL